MSLLIVRGDLQSHSGYSSAIRAYLRVLESQFERIAGIDIHFDSQRSHQRFPYPLVSMAEARRLAEQSSFTLALSCTVPDQYVRLPGAVNVGMTFWESDLPHLDPLTRRPTLACLESMDALWAPCTETRRCHLRAGVSVPIAVVPWPMEPIVAGPDGLPDGNVYDLDHSFASAAWLARLGRLTSLGFRGSRRLLECIVPQTRQAMLQGLRTSPLAIPDPLHRAMLCVAQDVPRKALLLLLAEWLEFKRRPEADGWSLILKSFPYGPAVTQFQFVTRFWTQVQALKRQLRVRRAGVYLWTSDLSADEYARLIGSTCGGIACALGEGFCGPAAQTLLAGKPMVLPRHTAFLDYVDAKYPFIVPTRPSRLSFLGDPLAVYDPLTAWHVPEPLGIADVLSRMVKTSRQTMEQVSEEARRRIESWCDPARVQRLLAREIVRLARAGFRPLRSTDSSPAARSRVDRLPDPKLTSSSS